QLAQNSGVTPAPAPSQLSAANFAIEGRPRHRALWPWGLMAVAASAAALLWRGATSADVPKDRPVAAAQTAGKDAPVHAGRPQVEPERAKATEVAKPASPEPAKVEPEAGQPEPEKVPAEAAPTRPEGETKQ